MYVSRAVETIRDDPVPGESIELVVETDAEQDEIAAALEDAGATVDRRLQFDDVAVTVPQENVDAICEIAGVTAVQTADAIGIHADEAEEDIDLEE